MNKKLITSIYALCLLLGLAACTEELKYEPAEVPTNAQVYFSSAAPATVSLSADMSVTSFGVTLYRIDKTDALTVNLLVQNEEPEVFTVPTSASFSAGAETTTITINYEPEILGYDTYKTIGISISDGSLTTPYGKPAYEFRVGIPAPWESLGKATYMDTWMPFSHPYSIELQQHQIDPTRYRLVEPYSQYIIDAHEPTQGNQSPFFEFQILPAGSVYRGVTTTIEGIVTYADVNTGVYEDGYEADIWLYHPSRFTANQTEESWSFNAVKRFTPEGKPALVQIAPYYYMVGVGGWNYSQRDGIISIIFPGVVLVDYDYSISLSYLGHYIDKDDVDNAIVEIKKGDDAANYKYVVLDGVLSAATAADIAEEIIAGTIATEEDTESAYKIFPLENAGNYSVVAVTFDDSGEAQDYGYVSFEFTPAGTDNPWVSLGFCEYTDDVLITQYAPESYIITYDVQILEHRDTPGLFRLKNAYGEDYPYNDPGDYEEGNVYIEIDATDSEGVFIDFQSMGVDWGDGAMYIYSLASLFMDEGATLEEVKEEGVCGTFKDGVITFPEEALLIYFEDDGLYYANLFGKWKVDMSSLRSSISKSASLRSGLTRSFSPKQAPFSLKANQPVRVKGKNMPDSAIKKNTITAPILVR